MTKQIKTVDGKTGEVSVRDMSQAEADASARADNSSMEPPADSIEQRIAALEAAIARLEMK